jgi:hypothetical protein
VEPATQTAEAEASFVHSPRQWQQRAMQDYAAAFVRRTTQVQQQLPAQHAHARSSLRTQCCAACLSSIHLPDSSCPLLCAIGFLTRRTHRAPPLRAASRADSSVATPLASSSSPDAISARSSFWSSSASSARTSDENSLTLHSYGLVTLALGARRWRARDRRRGVCSFSSSRESSPDSDANTGGACGHGVSTRCVG